MSTTHPTNITTEWDDLQRKYGNLPKLEKEETNEVRDARIVELTEEELLRESRLKAWKKKFEFMPSILHGTPVNINEETFIQQVTESSKCHRDDAECSDMLSRPGSYVPVLLLDESKKECNLLKKAWNILAKKHDNIKFTVGLAQNILKSESGIAQAPSSILLYFGGVCILQKHSSVCFANTGYDIAEASMEERVANIIESILNSVPGHSPFKKNSDNSSSDSSDYENEDKILRASGAALKREFLHIKNKCSRYNNDNEDLSDFEQESGKTYTSWILDKALGKRF